MSGAVRRETRDTQHPFYPMDAGYSGDGKPLKKYTVADRCSRIKLLTLSECIAACDNPRLCLRATVCRRLNARIRKLTGPDHQPERKTMNQSPPEKHDAHD